jgi:hypothetical protein
MLIASSARALTQVKARRRREALWPEEHGSAHSAGDASTATCAPITHLFN